jgi:hypothetical protein
MNVEFRIDRACWAIPTRWDTRFQTFGKVLNFAKGVAFLPIGVLGVFCLKRLQDYAQNCDFHSIIRSFLHSIIEFIVRHLCLETKNGVFATVGTPENINNLKP